MVNGPEVWMGEYDLLRSNMSREDLNHVMELAKFGCCNVTSGFRICCMLRLTIFLAISDIRRELGSEESPKQRYTSDAERRNGPSTRRA